MGNGLGCLERQSHPSQQSESWKICACGIRGFLESWNNEVLIKDSGKIQELLSVWGYVERWLGSSAGKSTSSDSYLLLAWKYLHSVSFIHFFVCIFISSLCHCISSIYTWRVNSQLIWHFAINYTQKNTFVHELEQTSTMNLYILRDIMIFSTRSVGELMMKIYGR